MKRKKRGVDVDLRGALATNPPSGPNIAHEKSSLKARS